MTPAATLLIDDATNFADALRQALKLRNISLDYAEDWDSGLSAFRTGLHELVIADYNIPDSQNGLHLLSAIKLLRPSSRLLLISGALPERAAEIVRQSHVVDEFLLKSNEIGGKLVAEALDATARANSPTNWRQVAEAHLAAEEVEEAEIRRVDEILRNSLHLT